MILILGGAYQGKCEYAVEKYGLSDGDVFRCSPDNTDLSFDKKVIYGLDKFSLACVREQMANSRETDPRFFGSDIDLHAAVKILSENRRYLEDKILIADDISQGTVPMDPEARVWREMNGRMLIYLAREADAVERVFAGIGTAIK